MRKRKLIGAIVAIVMSASFAAGLSACGGNDEHSHSWTYKDVGGGYHREECSCGEYKEPEVHHDVDGDDVCDECHADLTTVVAVTSVTLDQTSATITVGGATLTLTATVNPVGAATVLWESSDTAVATVSNGVVTAVKAGTATITAKAGDKSATCDITVNAAPPATAVEMDEEKWAAAFTFGEKIGATSTVIRNSQTRVMTLKFDGKKAYMSQSGSGYEAEAYLEETEDGKTYQYMKGYEYWTKGETSEASIDETKAENFALAPMFPFEKFEQGTVNGEYVAKEVYSVSVNLGGEDLTINVKSAALHFDGNGKLVSMEYVTDGEEGDEHYFATFDYNPTVTLPVVLLGGQVTEAQWNAALQMNYGNYRVGVSMYGMVVNEFKCDGNKRFTSYGQFGSSDMTYDQTYYLKESDGVYAYKTEHGRTTKEKTTLTDEQYAAMNAIQFFGINTAQYVKSNFEFDEESGMYSADLDGVQVSVKFKDGKLVWARQIDESNYEDYSIDFVYGDTNIIIPTVNTIGGQVSDDEWTAALAMSDAKMQMEVDVMYQTYIIGELVGKKDGDKLYQLQKANGKVVEMYAVKDGDKYYSYYVMDGVWVKEEIEENDYAQNLPSAMFASLDKVDYTWNAATQSYIPKNGGMISEIRFVNKKVDYVLMQANGLTQKFYFSYGTGMVTLPNEGDAADSDDYSGGGSGSGGSGGEVKPSIDIDIEEWNTIFENLENCPEFGVYVQSSDGEYQYTFVDNDSIAITDKNTQVTTTYKLDGGSLKKIIVTATLETQEQESEYKSLEEAKIELLRQILTIEGKGNIAKLYSMFQGADGQYQFSEDGNYIVVMVQEGKLTTIVYGENSEGMNCVISFAYPDSEGSQGAEKN